MPKYFYRQPTSRVWSVRIIPPKHTRHAVSEREFRRSTGHVDLKLATPVGLKMVAEKLSEWNALARLVNQQPTAATPTGLSDDLIEDLCKARLYSWLGSDDDERAQGLSDLELEAIEDFCRLTDTAMRSAVAQGPGSSHWPDVVEAALDWAQDVGYELDPRDANFTKYIRKFAGIERKASASISGRNRAEEIATPPPPRDAFRTLSSIVDEFKAHKAPKEDTKHVATILNAWQLFIDLVGDIRFDSVKPGHIYDFMAARMNAEVKPWSESRTKGFGRRALREVFGLARTKGWMTIPNPVDGLEALPSLPQEVEESRLHPRFPFSNAQLNALFCSTWYDPSEKRRFTGKMRTDLGARYWVPLFGLKHGVRVGEGVQLVVSDFFWDGDVLVLSFRTELESDKKKTGRRRAGATPPSHEDATQISTLSAVEKLRSLKNPATRRCVPVHPALLALGLVEFIEQRRAAGGSHALLFPSSMPEEGGKTPKLGRAYEQAFLRFVRDTLDFGHGFGNHSFRHQLEDRVRDAQASTGVWPPGLGQQYTGRKRAREQDAKDMLPVGSEADYGNGYDPKKMLPWVERLDFTGVELPKPYAEWLAAK